jgi:hypothetical protein
MDSLVEQRVRQLGWRWLSDRRIHSFPHQVIHPITIHKVRFDSDLIADRFFGRGSATLRFPPWKIEILQCPSTNIQST